MKKGLIVPVGVLLAWYAISILRSQGTAGEAGQDPAQAPPERVPAAVHTVENNPASTKAAEPLKQGVAVMVDRPFEFQRELDSYLDLQTKVFLTDGEKRERAGLLRNPGLIRALGSRLKVATRSKQVMLQQDAAIDLILEALHEGDSAVAAEVLRDVVTDGQIENAGMEKAAREQLAGLKAEVLYQWSASNPQIASNLQSWLPGPVSKKIWDNVLRMQENNVVEGAAAEGRAASH